jgi:tetratricopeptide (TPR) repeat protein
MPSPTRRCLSLARLLLAAFLLAPAVTPPARAQMTPDQQADLLLNSARKAYNEKNYPFAAERFREFLQKFGGHKSAPSARYGLALALIEGPAKDYPAAVNELNQLAGNKALPEYPFVLYYLGLAQRGQGVGALEQALAKPAEAAGHRGTAAQRFDEASRSFAQALAAFGEKLPKAAGKDLPRQWEWAARARCDLAEMLLRQGKAKEAQDAAKLFTADAALKKSRYRGLGLYYHGLASFQLKDARAAGRSLALLTPFDDPIYGTHARYLLARVHHEAGERAEARLGYEAVLAGHARHKHAAAEALKQPDRFKDDPDEKTRLERLANGLAPDHVARAMFFLGVLLYEDGRFGEALGHFQGFAQQFPTSPLAPEAVLRVGFCQVQQRQFADAAKTLQPLSDKEPRLADQALLWLARAQVGAADPANPQGYEQAVKAALDTYRRAADKANQLASADPEARTRRGEILADMGDAQQLVKQYREAAGAYNQVISEKLLPTREEELYHSTAVAWQLAGDFNASDEVCRKFREVHPKSTLLGAILFRHAENAYLQALAAEKIADPNQRKNEVNRLNDEALKRYGVVVDKYPEYAHVHLARFGMAMALYRKGEFDKARPLLEAIPAAERTGELADVPYYLADLFLRQAPAKADDALAAGKLQEQLKAAVEQLELYTAALPNGPQTADALLKLGYCHQRLAGLLAQQADKDKAVAAARAAYEQLLQRFPKDPAQPAAVFERAKCLALANDGGGAVNELRRFLGDPLKTSTVAPMACLHLATLLRGQNNPAEAAKVLEQCRKDQEPVLQKDPARSSWIALLQYHHGVALREADKRPEARAALELVVRVGYERPEAGEAALRFGQCLKEEAEAKLAEGRKKLAQPNLNPQDQAAARKQVEEGARDVTEAAKYLIAQADGLGQKQPAAEARARMLYEAAWAAREVGEVEIEQAREKIRQELWQKRRDEVAKQTPPGAPAPFLPPPEVPLALIPVQPSESQARAHYQALIAAFPDVAVNADARFELAEMLGQRGEHDAAVKLLREAIDKEPRPELTDKVRVRLGDALLLKGDAKAALAHFNTVAANAMSPAAPQALYRAGEAYLALKDPAEAVKRLAAFRDQGPLQNLPGLTDRALLRLGFALGLLEQWEPSRQAYEQVVNRFGNGPWTNDARYGMGWAYQKMGQFDNAVHWYGQVTANVVTEPAARAQLNVGLCRLAQKRYPEASSALLVVPFTYDYPELAALALVEAARALAEDKQTAHAVKLLERVVRDYAPTQAAAAAKKRLAELKKS